MPRICFVDGGRLTAVIDFGTLSIGQPAAEHGTIWDFPAAARDAYRNTLGLTDDEWVLSLGWTLLPALTGLPYYWDSWPDFARSCLDRIRLVMDEVSALPTMSEHEEPAGWEGGPAGTARHAHAMTEGPGSEMPQPARPDTN